MLDFIVMQMSKVNREKGYLTVCYPLKTNDVSFSCVCPVIDNEFRHNIVKVVCGSTQQLPRGSTATLTVMTKFMINSRTDMKNSNGSNKYDN